MVEKNEQNWMTHSCGSLHCIQTVPLRCVTESLFIAIAYVNFLVYNTRSAAVLWPNKFNTTYALHRPMLDAFLHTRTDNTQIYLHLFLLTTLVSFIFYFISFSVAFNTRFKILYQIQFHVDRLIQRYTKNNYYNSVNLFHSSRM